MTSTHGCERNELIGFALSHALLRDELPRIAAALGAGATTPGRQAVLEGHVRLVTDHLVRHHEHANRFHWPRLVSRVPAAAAMLAGLEADHVEMDALVEPVCNRALPRAERSAAMRRLVKLALTNLDEEDRSVIPLLAVHLTAEEQRTATELSRARIPLADELRVLAMMLAVAGPAERIRMLAGLPDSVGQLVSDREAPALRRVHQVLAEITVGSGDDTRRLEPARSDRPGVRARIAAWTGSALRDMVYCGAICVWSVASFAIVVSGVCVTGSLLLLVIGVIVWVGFVHVMRWVTAVDRALAGWRRHQTLRGVYRRPSSHRLPSLVKTLSSDRQTWQDLGWLVLAPMAGFTLGLIVVTAATMTLGFLAMPAWYWAVSDPQLEYGVTNLGLFTVDTMHEALVTTGIGLAMIPLVLVMARGLASSHSRLAVRVLAPGQTDPVG